MGRPDLLQEQCTPQLLEVLPQESPPVSKVTHPFWVAVTWMEGTKDSSPVGAIPPLDSFLCPILLLSSTFHEWGSPDPSFKNMLTTVSSSELASQRIQPVTIGIRSGSRKQTLRCDGGAGSAATRLTIKTPLLAAGRVQTPQHRLL